MLWSYVTNLLNKENKKIFENISSVFGGYFQQEPGTALELGNQVKEEHETEGMFGKKIWSLLFSFLLILIESTRKNTWTTQKREHFHVSIECTKT